MSPTRQALGGLGPPSEPPRHRPALHAAAGPPGHLHLPHGFPSLPEVAPAQMSLPAGPANSRLALQLSAACQLIAAPAQVASPAGPADSRLDSSPSAAYLLTPSVLAATDARGTLPAVPVGCRTAPGPSVASWWFSRTQVDTTGHLGPPGRSAVGQLCSGEAREARNTLGAVEVSPRCGIGCLGFRVGVVWGTHVVGGSMPDGGRGGTAHARGNAERN